MADFAHHEFATWEANASENVLFETLFIWNLMHCSVGNSEVILSLALDVLSAVGVQ